MVNKIGLALCAVAVMAAGCASQRDYSERKAKEPRYDSDDLYEYTQKYCQEATEVELGPDRDEEQESEIERLFWDGQPKQAVSFEECMREYWVEPDASGKGLSTP